MILFLSPIRAERLFEKLHKYLKLQWIYEQKESKQERKFPDPKIGAEKSITAPPLEEIELLYEQASMGDIQGILKQLQKIENSGGHYGAFVAKVQNLANDYRMKEIRDFVDTFLS